jgi:serine/threonine-protein kinase
MGEDEETLRAASARVGTTLNGKYRVDRVIGIGGMATVYAVTHRNRKRFAIKMLHPEFSVRRDIRARFIREGYVANSVAHPGVVAVLDDDTDEAGAAFLVMELLEGRPVEMLYALEKTPIPVREALAIACQLLDILDAAHEKSVIHRDVKPANLFLLNDGQLKIVDFGIARLRDAEPGLKSTRTGATLGTPAFMPPEQALALPSDIDARTDIWAAGATLFTMLSARYVHEADNARQMMIRAATEPARSLASVAPHVPTAVVEVVMRALEFERSERWPSAAAMRDALLAIERDLFGEPSQSDLAALVKRAAASAETSPTEPSPEPLASATPSRTTVAQIPGPLVAGSRELVSTTSRPVSTGNTGAPLVTPGRAALAVGAVALVGTAVAIGWRARTEPPALLRNTSGGQAAARVTTTFEARSAPAIVAPLPANPSAVDDINSPPAAGAPSAAPTPSASSPSASAEPHHGAAVSPAKPSARSRERAAVNEPPVTSAAHAVTASPPSNPLKLELQ